MNSRFVLALGISAGMALLVSGVFYQMAVRGRSSATQPTEMQEVVVATNDLEIGSTISPEDLRLEPWPRDKMPEDSFTNFEEVINRVPISRILANEPVLVRRLASPGSGVGLAPKVPPGMRALSVRVDDVIGVAGFVLPEARVDVLVTGTPRDSPAAGRMTRTILDNVRVISAGENLAPDASGRPQRVPVVTLLLTPDQAELLTLAASQGRIQLVLRNSSDEGTAETRGVRERELFAVGSEPRKPRPKASQPEPAPMARLELPPPVVQVEVIRGNQKSVESFTPSAQD